MTAIFPLAVWQPGTLQPSTPVNDNALRVEVLQRGATSILSTPPGSPADGDVHIVGASPTGAWSTFAQNDVVIWRSGTWYRFAPFTGWLKQVGTEVRRFDGSAWVVVTGGGGGGAVPVQDEGAVVVAAPTAINFVGNGVTTTSVGGVATVNIPGGGGGGGSVADPGDQSWGFIVADTDGGNFSRLGGFTVEARNGAQFRNVSAASLADSLPRIASGSFATPTSVCGFRGTTAAPFCIGPSANIGGFTVKHRVIVGQGADTPSHRFFAGLRNWFQNAVDEQPSSLTDIIGIGYDSADTQLQVIHNDASGAATKVPLGASFPKPTIPLSRVYDIELSATAGSGQVAYVVADVATGARATGTISTNLPAGTTMLTFYDYLSAGGTSTAVSLEACWWYFRIGKPRP